MDSVHVIGGGAGIGRWLIDRVFYPASSRIYCYDTNPKALETLSPNISRCLVNQSDGYSQYSDNFQSGALILMAIPFNFFEATVKQLVALIRPDSLVASLSSIQAEAICILKDNISKDSSICGCHPLFGPAVSSPIGQLVAITEFDDKNSKHQALKVLLEAGGLITTTINADQHDVYMSYVQALAHFTLLGFSATLAKDGIHPRDLLKLRTPNFQFLYAFASRVVKLSATTTGAIQTTKDASEIRSRMLDTLTKLHKQFEAAGDTKGCANVIEELRAPLSGAEVDEGAELASMAVDSFQDFEEILFKYKKSGSPFVFRQRTTGRLRVVRIIDIRHDEISFEEATKNVQRRGDTYLAIALNENARQNYRAIGLNVPKAVTISIKKRNIKLLELEELQAFYRKSILPIIIDHNFVNPHGMHEEYIEVLLPLKIKGLWHCEFREGFRKRGEIEKITLRLSFNPNNKRDDIVDKVRAAVEDRQLPPASKFSSRLRHIC